MRVLYFSRDFTTHDYRFLVTLGQSGHEIYFLRLEDDGIDYKNRALPDNIQTLSWSSGGGKSCSFPEPLLDLMTDFQEIVSSLKPDLIHAGPVQTCGFMSALLGFKPLILMSWGSDILIDMDKNNSSYWITAFTLKHSSMFICDCDAVKNKIKDLLPYTNDHIIQFPWGIDLSNFEPGINVEELRETKGWSDSFVVLSTRTWEAIYGIDILIKSFSRSYARNPKLRLVLVGDGSQEAKIMKLLTELELLQVVELPGRIPNSELSAYFQAADLYMSCTKSDGSSISLLEAMASSLPVLVSDVGGNPEWVLHGKNGWLASFGSIDEFSMCLLQASLMDSTKLQKIGARNRNIAIERADWHKNSARLLKAYEQVENEYAEK